MKNDNPSGERVQPKVSPEAEATNERRVVAWIGKAVQVEGKVVSQQDLIIDGHVEGSIELGEHSLTIGPDAGIKADLFAMNITISGAVQGNVRAVGRIDLRATGSVEGDVTAPRLLMADGAVVAGKVDVGGGRKS